MSTPAETINFNVSDNHSQSPSTGTVQTARSFDGWTESALLGELDSLKSKLGSLEYDREMMNVARTYIEGFVLRSLQQAQDDNASQAEIEESTISDEMKAQSRAQISARSGMLEAVGELENLAWDHGIGKVIVYGGQRRNRMWKEIGDIQARLAEIEQIRVQKQQDPEDEGVKGVTAKLWEWFKVGE